MFSKAKHVLIYFLRMFSKLKPTGIVHNAFGHDICLTNVSVVRALDNGPIMAHRNTLGLRFSQSCEVLLPYAVSSGRMSPEAERELRNASSFTSFLLFCLFSRLGLC